MQFRQKLNGKPVYVLSAIGLCLVAAIALTQSPLLLSREEPAMTYYTTDDASPEAAKAALFSASGSLLPPFTHDGKKAYRAHVFACDDGKTTWVAFLSQYTSGAHEQMKAAAETGAEASPTGIRARNEGLLVKRPGDRAWIPADSPEAIAVTSAVCPPGSRGPALEVEP